MSAVDADNRLLGDLCDADGRSRPDNNTDLPQASQESLREARCFMSALIWYLAAFGAYTICIILATGQSFAWNESRSSFYLGKRQMSWFRTTATFCATWMSPLSLVGYSIWLYHDGYRAFFASVNGWMLGLLFFPFIVERLRVKRVLSMPEWLEKNYGDARVRKLVALTMVFLYTLYLVIQFRAFGVVVSYMLEIPAGFTATSLIYLFVLYTTFGGYASVVRSDVINMLLILAGITAGAYFIMPAGFTLKAAGDALLMKNTRLAAAGVSSRELFSLFAIMFSWGLGVAGNPQYTVRLLACRTRKDAFKVTCLSPFIVGWIYICITFFVLVCYSCYPLIGNMEETMTFAKLNQYLPNAASTLMLIAVIAAAVSTANSQLLLAACSLCYDLFPLKSAEGGETDPMKEDKFLLVNRLAITAIASVALALCRAGLPDFLMLGRISWTLVAICYFYPLFWPRIIVKGMLFYVLCVALLLQFMFVFIAGISPEYSMPVVLAAEAAIFKLHKFFWADDDIFYIFPGSGADE